MMEGLSKLIRDKKKGNHKPDMDYAGQDAPDPVEAWDAKQADEVNEALDEPDHEPASKAMMGESESSQSKGQLKKSMARINKYLDAL